MMKKLFVAYLFNLSCLSHGITTILEKVLTPNYKKRLCFDLHAKLAQKQNNSAFFNFEPVKKSLGQLIRYNTVEDFIAEKDSISLAKQRLIVAANTHDYTVPISATDAVLLTYGDGAIECLRIVDNPTFHARSQLFIGPLKNALKEFYPEYLPLLNQLKQNEEITEKEGRHTYYHSIKKNIYKALYIHTKILELINNETNKDYLHLRIPHNAYKPKAEGAEIREEFLKKGSRKDTKAKDRYHLLSVNHTLLSNIDMAGESTLSFFANDSNISDDNFTLKTIFDHHHLTDTYAKHAQELEKLMIQSDSGILLEIVLNNPLVEKTSYPSLPFGSKIALDQEQEKLLSSLIKEKPGRLMRNYYDENPHLHLGRIQHRLILTDDYLLNPHNPETQEGFKVKAYALNQDSLDEFHQNVDALFEKIRSNRE